MPEGIPLIRAVKTELLPLDRLEPSEDLMELLNRILVLRQEFTLLPGPVALWSLLGFAGLFVIYPFLDRMLAERGWPMDVVNAIAAAAVVGAMVFLMYLDTQM